MGAVCMGFGSGVASGGRERQAGADAGADRVQVDIIDNPIYNMD